MDKKNDVFRVGFAGFGETEKVGEAVGRKVAEMGCRLNVLHDQADCHQAAIRGFTNAWRERLKGTLGPFNLGHLSSCDAPIFVNHSDLIILSLRNEGLNGVLSQAILFALLIISLGRLLKPPVPIAVLGRGLGSGHLGDFVRIIESADRNPKGSFLFESSYEIGVEGDEEGVRIRILTGFLERMVAELRPREEREIVPQAPKG